jgi:hypothetical protein
MKRTLVNIVFYIRQMLKLDISIVINVMNDNI